MSTVRPAKKRRSTLPKKILIWFLCLLAYALSTYIPIHISGDPINAAGIKGLIALLSLLISIFTALYLCRRVDRKQSEEDNPPAPPQPSSSPEFEVPPPSSDTLTSESDTLQPLENPESSEAPMSDIPQPTSQEQTPGHRPRGRLVLLPIDPDVPVNAASKEAPELPSAPAPSELAPVPRKSRKPAVILALCLVTFFGLLIWHAASSVPSTSEASSTSPYTTKNTSAPYVGSVNSSLVHRSSCRHVDNITMANRVYYSTRANAHRDGRTNCSTCLGGSTGGFAEWSDRRQSDTTLEQAINATSPPRIISLGPLNRPDNGYIFEEPGEEALAPLSILTQGENDYYIVLDPLNNAVWNKMSFYVRGGQSAKVFVPLGDYEIYYATGSAWYGLDDLFGSDTLYRKCDDTFEFYEDGDSYQGWTLTLYPQPNGNLDTETISANEFPG